MTSGYLLESVHAYSGGEATRANLQVVATRDGVEIYADDRPETAAFLILALSPEEAETLADALFHLASDSREEVGDDDEDQLPGRIGR